MTDACEFPKQNASSAEIKKILTSVKTIAVVGLSDKKDRPSFRVAAYLQSAGYRIFPVNPMISEALGEKAYPDLKSIPESIDVVDIFRKPEEVPAITAEAIAVKAKVIWMQEGIVNNAAAETARRAGLQVVMNQCMLKEHAKL